MFVSSRNSSATARPLRSSVIRRISTSYQPQDLLGSREQLWLTTAQLSSRSVQVCRAGQSNPFTSGGGAGVAVVARGDHNGCKSSKKHQTLLGVINDWVTSTKIFGSLIRRRPCGISTVYSVSLRLAGRAPKCVVAGSCSPFERWIVRMRNLLSRSCSAT